MLGTAPGLGSGNGRAEPDAGSRSGPNRPGARFPPDSLLADTLTAGPAGRDTLSVDSLRVARRFRPVDRLVSGSLPPPGREIARAELRRSATQEGRDAVADALDLVVLRPGAPQRPAPLSLGVPGRDVPELRVDGIPVVSSRWPETALSPLPLLAIESAQVRRYTPIAGPLSSTGGSRLDLTLLPPVDGEARSAIRLTQGQYATYTDEAVLRRPLGPVLFRGYYGDSKSDGRLLWGAQEGQTIGLRAGHRMAGGWATWGYDDASYRSRLLTTKRALWDRALGSLRWTEDDTVGTAVEGTLYGRSDRGRWETAGGLTERRGRAVGLRVLAERPATAGAWSTILEIEGTRTRVKEPGARERLLEDLAIGLAAGGVHGGTGWTVRASAGAVRLAPLDLSPVFAVEGEIDAPGLPRVLLHASRAVRHRSLPRVPTDGAAWVLQGIGLASEGDEGPPEALWRGAIEVANRRAAGGSEIRIGMDLLLDRDGLDPNLADLALLGIGQQDAIPADRLRSDAWFVSPWVRADARLPLNLHLRAGAFATAAEEGTESHLGLPALRWEGRFGWRARLFRDDLDLELRVKGSGRTEVATPYGTLPALGLLDGEIHARVGSADLFLVMANLTNVEQRSMSYDGGFMILPLRHYRAGITWVFLD
ncbi:MAG: hypothetical protein GF346_13245 [Candidatus Eisenbacteria bacterium]|nr:hypothetical protein [Candidatus Latescibacterota bacterium]MBD3303405.1 hypothetical protein [Candidatus Eisenbacteria bacterium]